MGQSISSGWGKPDASTQEMEKPGDASGLYLSTSVNSSGGADSSGSDVVSSTGPGTLSGGSIWVSVMVLSP